ncbi:hypothetical protein AB0D99_22285 [Streptomyces sp. NPDC047971]|uniref:hypothetical protein n=1 Tax=Streptomyces sp. NPDC047971 TaxID=3154499 RepID=UPI0033DDC10F
MLLLMAPGGAAARSPGVVSPSRYRPGIDDLQGGRCSMGASGWDYITGFDGDVEAAVATLRSTVFQEQYGGGARYRSLEELYADEEFMGTEGTHSIVDIDTVVATDDPPKPSRPADYGTLRPLAMDRVAHHFATERPSVEQFEALVSAAHDGASHEEYEQSLLGECQMRWTGYYVILYSNDRPTHLGIFGYSGD